MPTLTRALARVGVLMPVDHADDLRRVTRWPEHEVRGDRVGLRVSDIG
jgi:hypothetical protein